VTIAVPVTASLRMLRITPTIAIDPAEISEQHVRASGPGGQNVNKVATAVQLRFDVGHSPSLPEAVRRRLASLAGRRLSSEGILIIDARRFRSQERNRDDAYARLVDLVRRAATPPKPRRATKPSPAERERRMQEKRRRSATKRRRATSLDSD
jgi:ribosome-associated protein